MGQSFAIVPAAGHSQRMGTPKLLLPWGSGTVIQQVLSAWQASDVEHVLVTVRADDQPLADACRAMGAEVVIPASPPPDMKASVRCGLEAVDRRFAPSNDDVWLTAPADIPRLSADVVNLLLAAYADTPGILVPTHDGRRGHPVLFPWRLASEVESLSEQAGLKDLLARYPVCEIPCPADAVAPDVDTPEDYRRLRGPGNDSGNE